MYNKNKACTPEKQLPVIQTLVIKLPVHPSNAQVMIACTLLLLQGFEIAKILFCKYFNFILYRISYRLYSGIHHIFVQIAFYFYVKYILD